jgi:hypothetical protein
MSLYTGINGKQVSIAPMPKHQAIGKNGSFWMPKDIPEINKQNIDLRKKIKSQNSPGSNQVSSSTKKAPKNFSKTSAKTFNFEKVLTASNKVNTSEVSSKNPSSGKLISHSKLLSQLKSLNLPLSSDIKSASSILSVKNNGVVGSFLKELKLSPNLIQSFNQSKNSANHEDLSNRGGGRQKSNGAKNASSVSRMEVADSNETKFASFFNASEVFKGDSNGVSKFVKFVGKSVLPRMGYLQKFEKKVLRFAIDLPSGEKMGVRLEKSDRGISLAFISNSSGIRDLLNSCKPSISKSLHSNLPSLQINVFSDYQEMDDFFNV